MDVCIYLVGVGTGTGTSDAYKFNNILHNKIWYFTVIQSEFGKSKGLQDTTGSSLGPVHHALTIFAQPEGQDNFQNLLYTSGRLVGFLASLPTII